MNQELHGNKLNWKGEVLLDVVPDEGKEDCYFVYNISAFLSPENGRDRQKHLDKVSFTIQGNLLSVLIIDYFGALNDESAKALAIKYVAGDFTDYRLD